MSLSIKDLVKSDIYFFNNQQPSNYLNISIENIISAGKLLTQYKQIFGKDKEYLELKRHIKLARASNFTLRISDLFKQNRKDQRACPIELNEKIPQNLRLEPNHLEYWLQITFNQTSLALGLGLDINWVHGTNSSILPFLSASNYRLIPTGQLLQNGIAPMSGEISCGGMDVQGTNQNSISALPIEGANKSWEDYAKKKMYHFPVEKYENIETTFVADLESLKSLSPADDKWDTVIVSLLRSKQWNPKGFAELCKKYENQIKQVIQAGIEKSSLRENSILKALDWDLDDLRAACTDETKRKAIEKELGSFNEDDSFDWYKNDKGGSLRLISTYFINDLNFHWKTIVHVILKVKLKSKDHWDIADVNAIRKNLNLRIQKNLIPYKRRFERLQMAFERPPAVNLTEQDRAMIQSPFPILFASTKTKGKSHIKELSVKSAQLEKDINIIFVDKQNISTMNQWLRNQDIHTVQVLDAKYLEEMQQFPLYHSPFQVLENSSYLSMNEQRQLQDFLEQKVFPLYRIPYQNGQHRVVHGVPHALRVSAIFGQIIAELYKEQLQKIRCKPTHLICGIGLHDVARQGDGVDKWDKQSGEKCEEVLEEMGADKITANLFNQAIDDKESQTPNSLEHKILHDSDCLEIMRDLSENEDFDFKRLWIYKELEHEVVFALIHEAKEFISLTEIPTIKNYIENHAHPYAAIINILSYAHNNSGRFSLMVNNLSTAFEAFEGNISLPQEIQQKIQEKIGKRS